MASFLRKISAQTEPHYQIPRLPDDLKYPHTPRERIYLNIIERLMDLVRKDPMTGLEHKEHFREQPRAEGVYILVDGDGLKKINDTFGHAAGHAAILSIADGIRSVMRSKDITVTRSGGDEFIVHVEHVSIPTGIQIANRILDSIRRQSITKHYSGADKEKLASVKLTASLGVGYTEADADKALYKAKEKGRNRVEFFSPKVDQH